MEGEDDSEERWGEDDSEKRWGGDDWRGEEGDGRVLWEKLFTITDDLAL